ncbi:MAG: class I SAM-dependent methyltransferase, partial [Humidesulfovibrio sp.]|nr:class I SAM-dependent methyltransferase [Humidesulfovibrio sp.]
KLRDQRDYWAWRGQAYRDEILASGYLEREVFFQDMIMQELEQGRYASAFEAGCGFGWNVKRVKEQFPRMRVGGLDFSWPQLRNMQDYKPALAIDAAQGDACGMPFVDNAFDVGFTLGVFMNIHPDKISLALAEMVRVCRKRIIHVEWSARYATPELAEKRAFKTNIVSHDYDDLYAQLGIKAAKVLTHKDFGQAFRDHERMVSGTLDRWEGFEGADKYTVYVFDL